MPQNVLLCILDGWGIDEEAQINPIKTHAPYWQHLLNKYPHAVLEASAEAVGLPPHQMGNSEVGHTTIGLGRVVMQDLPRIDRAIKQQTLQKEPRFVQFYQGLKASGKPCHLLGLFSSGGVHSHVSHIIACANHLIDVGIPVYLHAFLDGRDTPPKSFLDEYKNALLNLSPKVRIATLSGRYYAMDRDQRWDRTEKAYQAIMNAQSQVHFAQDIPAIMNQFYDQNFSDEFIPPCCEMHYTGINPGDGLLMANFRADRARQLLHALLDPTFQAFHRQTHKVVGPTLGLSTYSVALSPLIPSVLDKASIHNGLGEVMSYHGFKQLRIAETEKYAHVTFFFNGGNESPFPHEERVLIPSPAVATYDLKPEMSAQALTDHVIQVMQTHSTNLIVLNYANPDMVGHTGQLEAIQSAVQTIDTCLEKIEAAALLHNWIVLVTADHGNAEHPRENDGQIHTAHTCNPVPFMMINGQYKSLSSRGTLADIAPTILKLFNIPQPKEMTGIPLLEGTCAH